MEEDNNPIKEMGTKTMEPNVGQSSGGQTSQANSVAKKVNGSALASFIFSLVGLVIAGLPCGIVAIITGILGLVKFNKETEKFKWMAIVGIIVGVADVVLVTLNIILQVMQLAI